MRAKKLLNGSARLYPALKWFWVVVVVGLVLEFLFSFIYAIATGGDWEPTSHAWLFLGKFGAVIALIFLALALLTLQAWSSHRRQIDPILLGAAKIIKSADIQIGRDVVVQGFRPEVELERTVERLARDSLQEHQAVVIIGRPKSGKTRLAVKLIQELPNATAIFPRTDEPPLSFSGLALQGRDLILFCDDLHQNAETLKPLLWKQRLEEATGRRCTVICTTRDGKEWQRVERSQGPLLDAIGRNEVYVYASRVEAVGEDVSPEQAQELARALGIAEDDFLGRFDGTPGSLTLDLADMRRRYRMLQDEVLGSISMARLLDSAKLMFAARQPRFREPVLRAVAEKIRGSGRVADEAWDALRRRTEQEGFGWFEEGAFIIYGPYLEQCVAYEPSTADLEALLPVLADAADVEGMFYLGVSLQETSPVVAERANRAAAAGGIPAAFNNLGFVLVQQGRLQEAEDALRIAAQAGISDAFVQLGRLLLGQPGREDEAEEIFRAAVRAGYPEGYRNLGFFLSQQGRVAEAEQVYREAIAAGDTSVWFGLGTLLFQQGGREDEVEEAYQRAAELGDIGARNNLGNLLMEQGRL
jgi:tetratricopeptide (TPR) repeat protein